MRPDLSRPFRSAACSRSALVAACLTLALLPASPSRLHAEEHFSYVLLENFHATNPELAGLPSNVIFTYDDDLDIAVVASTRLADALTNLGTDARVDAFSYGLDIGGMNDHTFLYFSVSVTDAGSAQAIGKTPLFREPASECQADLFSIQDGPAPTREYRSHKKLIDDNGDSPVPTQRLEDADELGLTGTYGKPKGLAPAVANVSGFDVNPHDPTFTIYFSVDRPIVTAGACGGRAAYSPADILELSPGGVISCFKSAESLGLDPDGDDLDGLALNLRGWGIPPNGPRQLGWYSLTRDSVSCALFDHAAGDIFQFVPTTTYSAPPLHIRSEYAGLLSRFSLSVSQADIDADIDTISAVDPTSEALVNLTFLGPDTFAWPGSSPLDTSYGVVLDGSPISLQQATVTQNSIAPVEEGDHVVVDLIGYRGEFALSGTGVLEVPGTLEPVTEVVAEAFGSQVVWTWTNPTPNPYAQLELRLDDDPPILVAPIETEFVSPDLSPGVHSLRIRGLGATGGASRASYSAFHVEGDPTVEAVEEFVATDVGGGEYELSWVSPGDLTSVELSINNGPPFPVSGPLVPGETGVATVLLDEGRSFLALRGFLGATPTAEITIAVDREPRRPGDVISEALGVLSPGVTDLTTDLGGFVYVVEATGVVQVFAPGDLTNPVGAIFPPSPGDVRGLAHDGGGLLWAIEGQLWQTDPFGGSPFLLGPLVLPAGGPVVALAFDGTELWAVDGDFGIVSAHDPGTGAATGAQFTVGADPVRAIAARLGQPGELEVVHGPAGPGEPISGVAPDGFGFWSTTSPLAAPIVGLGWAPFGSGAGSSLYLVTEQGDLFEVRGVDAFPPPELFHCHDFVGSEFRFEGTGGLSIPDGLPLGVMATQAVAGLPGPIADLDVAFDIDHEQLGDVDVFLTSPTGTIVQLYGGDGGTQTEARRRVDDNREPGSFNDGFGMRPAHGADSLASFDGEDGNGVWTLTVIDNEADHTGVLGDWSLSFCVDTGPMGGTEFVRGDCNADGNFDIADAITLLSQLFGGAGGGLSCEDACDSNDDGALDIGDPISILNAQFQAGAPLPSAPFPGCGPDPTSDALDCGAATGGC